VAHAKAGFHFKHRLAMCSAKTDFPMIAVAVISEKLFRPW